MIGWPNSYWSRLSRHYLDFLPVDRAATFLFQEPLVYATDMEDVIAYWHLPDLIAGFEIGEAYITRGVLFELIYTHTRLMTVIKVVQLVNFLAPMMWIMLMHLPIIVLMVFIYQIAVLICHLVDTNTTQLSFRQWSVLVHLWELSQIGLEVSPLESWIKSSYMLLDALNVLCLNNWLAWLLFKARKVFSELQYLVEYVPDFSMFVLSQLVQMGLSVLSDTVFVSHGTFMISSHASWRIRPVLESLQLWCWLFKYILNHLVSMSTKFALLNLMVTLTLISLVFNMLTYFMRGIFCRSIDSLSSFDRTILWYLRFLVYLLLANLVLFRWTCFCHFVLV